MKKFDIDGKLIVINEKGDIKEENGIRYRMWNGDAGMDWYEYPLEQEAMDEERRHEDFMYHVRNHGTRSIFAETRGRFRTEPDLEAEKHYNPKSAFLDERMF